jgi:hypothetical protein
MLLTCERVSFCWGGRYELMAEITGMALSGARSVTYGGLLVTSSGPVAPVGQDLMTIHRTGTMSRRGAHARDTGSTTGVATAVLALLSAGTLASLGLVTADELRGGSSGNLSAPYNDLLPPVAVVVTPTPAPHAPGSGRQGGGRGSQPAVGPFELAAVTGGVDGSGPTLASSGPGAVEVTPPTVATPVPAAPVFTALDPTPAPSVLAVKHGKDGKRAGHAHAPGQANKAAKHTREDPAAVPAADPTSLVFLGVTPAVSVDKHVRPEHGHAAHGRSAHQRPAVAVVPALPAAAPASATPAVPPADPSGPGNGHGYAYGHDKA